MVDNKTRPIAKPTSSNKAEVENNRLLDIINGQDVKIADLEKQVKYYEQQISVMEKGVCDVCKVKDADYYEKQIKELKKDFEFYKGIAEYQQSCNMKRYFKLIKAKNLINAFLDFESACMENGMTIAKDIREEAEEFLKEAE